MKRLGVLLYTLLFVARFITAQTPSWMDAQLRPTLYNSESYYTGFAVSELHAGEALEKAYDRVRLEARSELVSSIRMSIKREVTDQLTNVSYGKDQAVSHDVFRSNTTIRTGIENIPGVQTEIYQHPKSKQVFAFAYVAKKDLEKKLGKQLMSSIAKLELQIEEAENQIKTGNKGEAKSIITGLSNLYQVIEDTQQTLLAIDASLTSEDIQNDEYVSLQKRAASIAQVLNDGYAIFIDCSAKMFEQDHPAFANSIMGYLSKHECYFVEDADIADWIIHIDASAEVYNQATFGNTTAYFVNVSATITLDKQATHKRVYADELAVQGSHTINNKDAAKDGYTKLSTKISEIIINNLK